MCPLPLIFIWSPKTPQTPVGFLVCLSSYSTKNWGSPASKSNFLSSKSPSSNETGSRASVMRSGGLGIATPVFSNLLAAGFLSSWCGSVRGIYSPGVRCLVPQRSSATTLRNCSADCLTCQIHRAHTTHPVHAAAPGIYNFKIP